jgi:hypothetical protein
MADLLQVLKVGVGSDEIGDTRAVQLTTHVL